MFPVFPGNRAPDILPNQDREHPAFFQMDIRSIKLEQLDELRPTDIEEYMEYLKYRFSDKNQEIINRERGIMRKICSLKSFYNYFFRLEALKTNPPALVQLPKLHEKEIIRLDIDEVALLLDEVEDGEHLTDKQKAYHAKTKVRDLALLTLLLGTGIRVSECVGLNIQDIDFKNGGIRIHRKGGKEVTVYFGTEVEFALTDYLDQRNEIIPESGHEDALFLSLQNKRISVRSVENLVKKYARIVTPLKKNYPPQAAQHLRHKPVPGNGGYLPGGRCPWTFRCKHNKKTLRRHGRRAAAKRPERSAPAGTVMDAYS